MFNRNGSSPRLRGTLVERHRLDLYRRFIPAPAGNASSGTPRALRQPVHPRACGERHGHSCRSMSFCGSSPRLRGTPASSTARPTTRRFIPAPAGNAQQGGRVRPRTPVHPRACGERSLRCVNSFSSCGSSPRLRGTLAMVSLLVCLARFIPAPAGNAASSGGRQSSQTVHPRACGERCTAAVVPFRPPGSSPRLRGTRRGPWRGRHAIPVHPRACGERWRHWQRGPVDDGSSPRLRGTPDQREAFLLRARFIPAPAGNAGSATSRPRASPVHPRACGERGGGVAKALRANGSSPRLRGTRRSPAPRPGVRPVHPRACGERTKRNRLSYKKKIGHEKSTEFFC